MIADDLQAIPIFLKNKRNSKNNIELYQKIGNERRCNKYG